MVTPRFRSPRHEASLLRAPTPATPWPPIGPRLPGLSGRLSRAVLTGLSPGDSFWDSRLPRLPTACSVYCQTASVVCTCHKVPRPFTRGQTHGHFQLPPPSAGLGASVYAEPRPPSRGAQRPGAGGGDRVPGPPRPAPDARQT